MTEEGITTEKEVVKEKVVVAPPVIVGGLVVMGAHLIHKRMLDIIHLIATKVTPNGVATIIFRDDNFPQQDGDPVHAKFFADSLSIAINVGRHMEEIIGIVEEDDSTASIRCLYWETMLNSLGHEFYHAKSFFEADEALKLTILGDEKQEEYASKFAIQLLFDLAKAGENLEPPLQTEDPILIINTEAFLSLSEDIPEDAKEDEWLQRQIRFIKEDILFEDTEGKRYTSFKQFLRLLPGAEYDDPAWDEPTEGLLPTIVSPEVVDSGAESATPVETIPKKEDIVPPLDWEPEIETSMPMMYHQTATL